MDRDNLITSVTSGAAAFAVVTALSLWRADEVGRYVAMGAALGILIAVFGYMRRRSQA